MAAKTNGSRKKLDLNPIYREVAQLLLHKNPEQISFSLVAKKTKVPRTTLYYYFDSKIESLIMESVRFTMKEFMQLWEDPSAGMAPPITSWEQLQKYKFHKAVALIEKSPSILQLYFRYCGHPSYVGHEIRHIEKLYLQTTSADWNRFHPTSLNVPLQHLMAQLKVGILWGLTGEVNHWKGHEEELADTCSKIFSLLNKTYSSPEND